MNTKFSLALLASTAMARIRIDTSVSDSAEFQQFIGTFNKSYESTQEMNSRMQVWLKNRRTVENMNASNKGTGVTFGLNDTGDMTDEEFKQRMGLVVPQEGGL